MVITVLLDDLRTEDINRLKNEYPSLNKAIISAVTDVPQDLKTALQQNFETLIELDANTPLPIENCYQTKQTLGKDRIAAVVGAFKVYPNSNILVIDAGTAITYDFINDMGQYLGGNISPGLEMRFKALHQFTGKLPLVRQSDFTNLFGRSTEEAIRAGVQHGIVHEADKVIDSFKEFYKKFTSEEINLISYEVLDYEIYEEGKAKVNLFTLVKLLILLLVLEKMLKYLGMQQKKLIMK